MNVNQSQNAGTGDPPIVLLATFLLSPLELLHSEMALDNNTREYQEWSVRHACARYYTSLDNAGISFLQILNLFNEICWILGKSLICPKSQFN